MDQILERVGELHESFVNGNLNFVIGEICDLPAARASLVSAMLTERMNQRDRAVFFRMLRNKIEAGGL